MHILKFIISLTLSILFIWALNRPWTIVKNDKPSEIPPLGKLLSPSDGFWQNAESKIPDFSSSVYADYLTAPVSVQYDDRMVPHIFAENLKDAAFVQGYVTASLRLWQMEFQTHAAAGRVSELIGHINPRAILFDKKKRREGMPWGAKKTLEYWQSNPDVKNIIDNYSAGINAYISSLSYADYPIEYKLLNYAPEKWTTLKCALLLKSMAETLVKRDEDFELTNAYKLLGETKFNQLYPEYFLEQSPIIQDTVTVLQAKVLKDSAMPPFLSDAFHAPQGPKPPKGIGSNNWAVSGRKTASGNPILCNDPHLELNLPSIWFEIQVKTPDFNAYGASLPGAPGIISGFNENIAWGVTNVSHDVRDWYAIQWKDASRQEYFFDSTYVKAEHVLDTIYVRGGQPVIDTIIYTKMGPIAYSEGGTDYALRWMLHEPSMEPLTFIKLLKGKNYNDYQDAIQHFSCPAQNLVFACKDGDIALWTQGKLPVRRKNQGKFVAAGTSSQNMWQAYIPQEHIPHEHNPEKGFVASANQHSIDPALYPYYYYGYFEEYRGRYLNRKLAEMSEIKVQDMKDLQNDNYSVRAEDFMPLFLKYLQRGSLSKEELEILALVDKWDYQYDKTSKAPSVFDAWMNAIFPTMYDEIDILNEQNALSGQQALIYPYEWQLLNVLKRDTAHFIVDNEHTSNKKESVEDIVTMAFQKACIDINRDTVSNEPRNWRDQKNTFIQHLGRIAPFSVDNVDIGGDGSALNAVRHRTGPSWRMVVELGDTINAYGIYPGGQSGNPGSPYYTSMMDKWASGKYNTLVFMQSAEDSKEKIIHSQSFNK
ncbi:MAG: penicillin acylase family protein [Aureispira sp.]|nr:penicillin acylase family protein [Aureispira sp.]